MGKNIDFAAGGYLPASFLDWEAHISAVIFCLNRINMLKQIDKVIAEIDIVLNGVEENT